MPKKPSSRKTPVRKFATRRIHKGCSYTAKDIAEIYGVDESAVHRWGREEGLIPIDDRIPAMFHYETLKQFLIHKNESRKMATGNAGDLPCFGCFMKRRAYEDKIIISKPNGSFWKVKGTCSCCGSIMNMNVPANEFLLLITWGYQLVEALPFLTIKGSKYTSVRTSGTRGKRKTQFQPKGDIKFNPDNERIKHRYFDRKLLRYDKKTVSMIVAAISVFEEYNEYNDFKLFCYDDAKGFQKYVLEKYGHTMQTAQRTISYVREFFIWLREQNGYRKLKFDDVDDLQLSRKDKEKAKASKPKEYLDASKWQELILNLKPKTDIEHRGRAMLATLLLTGARIEALLSFTIGDFNLDRNYAFQDANHVNTKFSLSHKTNLWKFSPELRQILEKWIMNLISEHGFSDSDPLFPRVNITTNELSLFQNDGFMKERVKSPNILREELYKQVEKAGFGHYTPHTIRNSIVALFHSLPLTLEQQKAISQNMSHKNLGTTMGYCSVSEYRQDDIIDDLDIGGLLKEKELQQNPKYQYIMSQIKDDEAVNKVFKALNCSEE